MDDSGTTFVTIFEVSSVLIEKVLNV
jgi:hypothetical protein